MNGRQTATVLIGIVLLILGIYFGMLPVNGAHPEVGPPSAVPFLDPVTAFDRRPDRVLLAWGLAMTGLATAGGGAYVMRDRP